MSGMDAILISIIPSIGVGLLFWYVMRAVIRADRNERAAIAAQEAALDASPAPQATSPGSSRGDAATEGHGSADVADSPGTGSGRTEA